MRNVIPQKTQMAAVPIPQMLPAQVGMIASGLDRIFPNDRTNYV
jgi:hypothetical protein